MVGTSDDLQLPGRHLHHLTCRSNSSHGNGQAWCAFCDDLTHHNVAMLAVLVTFPIGKTILQWPTELAVWLTLAALFLIVTKPTHACADCWHQHARDHQGQLQADPFKFPSGIKALADDIHGLGLLFGIYSDSGLLTCAGFPGSR